MIGETVAPTRPMAIRRTDVTFAEAISTVYQATKVLEYLSGMSCEDTDSLLVIRMVTRGQPNLTEYLEKLGPSRASWSSHS